MITILELEKKIIRKLFHCIGDQSFYWEIYNSALQEMNYNCSGEINYSGEKSAIKYVIENLIKTYPGQQLTMFDVGANIGNYTKELLSFTSEECNITIHCFEPSPETFFTLENELEGKKK